MLMMPGVPGSDAMTWNVWYGDGAGQRAELATIEVAELGALGLFLALLIDPLVTAALVVLAFALDPVFGPVPWRPAQVRMAWHA
jgi:hypothetical protein